MAVLSLIAAHRPLGGHAESVENGENVFLSEEGLRLLINMGEEEETILESEKQMIASILEMDETAAA